MKNQTREVLGLAALSALLLGMLAPGAAANDIAPAAADKVETASVLIDQLQGINEQPTQSGRQVSALKYHNGRIYVGYGDYSANTGPIDLYSYDATTGDPRFEIEVPTELIGTFPVLDGDLFAPYLDPDASHLTSTGYATERGGSWKLVEPIVGMIHNFDMATTDGTNLFISGSTMADGKAQAAIWYSADGETDWQLIRKVASPTATNATLDRFYWLEASEGKLYASARYIDNSVPKTLDVWENGSWSSTPLTFSSGLLSSGAKDVHLIGDMLVTTSYLMNGEEGVQSQIIYSISENRLMKPSEIKLDKRLTRFELQGDTLYGMASTGEVYTTRDGLNWTLLMTVSGLVNGSVFTVDEANSKIYIAQGNGTVASKIMVANIPDPVIPEVPDQSTGFCVVASSEHNGATLKGVAGGRSCVPLAAESN